jgi:hypothetical protein
VSRHRAPTARVLALALLTTACHSDSTSAPPADGRLAVGTWGGDSAGVIVTDSITHVHIGCTYGDIPGRVVLDADGRFTRAGAYLLRAYPIAIGPTMPTQFVGRVSGTTLTITVTVTDTIAKQTVIRGPASVRLGTTPRLANCPICRTPGERAVVSAEPTATWRHWYDAIRRWYTGK